MKRLNESIENGEEEDKEITIYSTTIGIYLQPQKIFEKKCLCLLVNSINPSTNKLSKDLYSILFNEHSSILLSPFIINKIKIKPLFNPDWNRDDLTNNYKCYEVVQIFNETNFRFENESKLI